MNLLKKNVAGAFKKLLDPTGFAIGFAIALALCLVSLFGLPALSFADNLSDSALSDSALSDSAAVEAAPPFSGAMVDSADIPADKVDQFAGAYLKVLQLLSDREPELPAAETSAEALKVQQSIEAEAVALIKDSGLTMSEYMQILGLASQDATFRDKVLGRMDESMQE